jgi:hypothetical protein
MALALCPLWAAYADFLRLRPVTVLATGVERIRHWLGVRRGIGYARNLAAGKGQGCDKKLPHVWVSGEPPRTGSQTQSHPLTLSVMAPNVVKRNRRSAFVCFRTPPSRRARWAATLAMNIGTSSTHALAETIRSPAGTAETRPERAGFVASKA